MSHKTRRCRTCGTQYRGGRCPCKRKRRAPRSTRPLSKRARAFRLESVLSRDILEGRADVARAAGDDDERSE